MAELVRRSGVSPATIRHYLRLELIPSPYPAAQNRYLYDRRHVQALHLVRLLRERRQMPLSEIGRILPSLAKMPGEQAFRPEMWDEVLQSHNRPPRDALPAQRLLDAGLSAFTRHGLSEVTVDDVCGLAGLAKGSFYLHYRSKEELFFATVLAAGAEVSRAFARAASAAPNRSSRAPGESVPSSGEGDSGSGGAAPGRTKGPAEGLTEKEAARLLATALAERLPLLLELLVLAAQRRPGHARVAQEVFVEVRQGIRLHLRPPVAEQAERRVVGEALVQGIRQVIGLIDEHPPSGA